MKYDYGFLTKKLREYLRKERLTATSKTRCVYDFAIRKKLQASLDDIDFIIQNLDFKQFDKNADKVYDGIENVYYSFIKKVATKSNLAVQKVPIKRYKIRVAYREAYAPQNVIVQLTQSVLDKVWDKNTYHVVLMNKTEYANYTKGSENNKYN